MFPSQEIRDLVVVDKFPCAVREVENLWIPLSDGIKLAARMWLPADAEQKPVPALFEYIPYRKRDGTLADDEMIHPFFAGHGYASLRIDLRGSGDSEGVLKDEYLPQEQDDALEVIQWLCDQPWCSGQVGMIGISWGGFAALQIAAREPQALKAIVTVGSTVDRYNDDIHYKNGCLLLENPGWAATMLSFGSRPPDPAVVGETWRDIWIERLKQQPYLVEQWIAHQHRDEYWKHGSVCENYAAIKAAVLAVSGWADAYTNAVPQLIQNLNAPSLGIIGPWPHRYPNLAAPGPAIGFLQECVRWWDQWLKGNDTGVMREPLYRVFCQTGSQPDQGADAKAGRWISETAWPSPHIENRRFDLTENGLTTRGQLATAVSINSPQDTGENAGEFVPHCPGPEMPCDQRGDDGRSLVFDTPPLTADLEILGAPQIELRLSIDKPHGNIFVRLCDVAPDGKSERIALGVLNLCHRDGNDSPQSVLPNEHIDVFVNLDHAAHRFPRGNRVRIAISTAYWPTFWPSPEAATLTLHCGRSRIALPVRTTADQTTPEFEPPACAPPANLRIRRAPLHERVVHKDQAGGVSTIEIVDDYGENENLDHGLIHGAVGRETYTIKENDPLSARNIKSWTQEFKRKDWHVRTETSGCMHCDESTFYFEGTVKAFENDRLIHEKQWQKSIPRSFV